MITEQLSHFMCFASGLSIFAKMAELFFADIKHSTLEANQKRSVLPVQVLWWWRPTNSEIENILHCNKRHPRTVLAVENWNLIVEINSCKQVCFSILYWYQVGITHSFFPQGKPNWKNTCQIYLCLDDSLSYSMAHDKEHGHLPRTRYYHKWQDPVLCDLEKLRCKL